MSELFIDINSDLGESAETIANGGDFELMRFITSANIACGGHAGDESTMKQTLAAARELNVAVGAHPSYPDQANFGRAMMSISTKQLETSVREQITSLAEAATTVGLKIAHVKPHGALYHAAKDRAVAEAIGRAVTSAFSHSGSQPVMVGQAGSAALEHWRAMGLHCAAEAFADRAYENDGTLRNRNRVGALLDTPARAAEQGLNIALHHRVITLDRRELPITADTLCIHSDTPNALEIARAVKRQLAAAGVEVRSLVIPERG
jgi:5-oxoprolinase (ATP-hydrolysing) subunit A